jgi:hypothetical protein
MQKFVKAFALYIQSFSGYAWLLAGLAIAGISCKKFVQVPAPVGSLDGATVFQSNATATAAVSAVYENMMAFNSISSGASGLSLLGGLQADELVNYIPSNTNFVQFYTNSLSSGQVTNSASWIELYKYIYVANAALGGLSGSTAVTPALSQQLTGEGHFIRAFSLFYLTQMYGAVPLPSTTTYQINESLDRTAQDTVMQQVIADLQEAQGLLSAGYVDGTGATTSERTRPDKGAATALLARAYLYVKDWKDAEAQASAVIADNTDYALLPDLNNVFLANSAEAIWQLEPVYPGFNTFDAYYFVMTGAPNPVNSVAMSPFLLESFEPGDTRRTDWVGSVSAGGTTYYYPFKYKLGYGKPLSEYLMVLRLAEQYLIRAEARAQQQNISGSTGALADLNVIRARAGLGSYTGAPDQASVLAAILHESQVEMFTEWGHRWFDLCRTGNITAVMDSVEPFKGGNWNADWQLYPININELALDQNLSENPGYQ